MGAQPGDTVESVVAEALKRSAADSSRYLDEACAGDAAFRAAVDARLADIRQSSTVTQPPRAAAGADSWVGTTIGRYQVRRLIASGGMGTVYQATQELTGQTVALKTMKAGFNPDSFLREMRTLGHLLHPGIARILDADELQEGERRIPFFVMEYLPSARSLTAYADEWRLSLRERLDLLARACDAVAHVHRKGVIHRDLKPSNILVDSSGQPKVIDFGLAIAFDDGAEPGRMEGTFRYMSLEQLGGDPEDLDARTDVYSLGVVAYELVCGRLPFNVDDCTPEQARRMLHTTAPAPASASNPEADAALDRIIARALARRREDRHSSAGALAEDLRTWLGSRSGAAGRTRWGRVALSATAIVLAVGGVMLPSFLRRPPPAPPAVEPPPSNAVVPERAPRMDVAIKDTWSRAEGGKDQPLTARPARPTAGNALNLSVRAGAAGTLLAFHYERRSDAGLTFLPIDYEHLESPFMVQEYAAPDERRLKGTFELTEPPGEYGFIVVLADRNDAELGGRLARELALPDPDATIAQRVGRAVARLGPAGEGLLGWQAFEYTLHAPAETAP